MSVVIRPESETLTMASLDAATTSSTSALIVMTLLVLETSTPVPAESTDSIAAAKFAPSVPITPSDTPTTASDDAVMAACALASVK